MSDQDRTIPEQPVGEETVDIGVLIHQELEAAREDYDEQRLGWRTW